MWIKPLSDGAFAVALINKDEKSAHNMVLKLSGDTDGTDTDKFNVYCLMYTVVV